VPECLTRSAEQAKKSCNGPSCLEGFNKIAGWLDKAHQQGTCRTIGKSTLKAENGIATNQSRKPALSTRLGCSPSARNYN
jgi:hypothetical protein